MKHIFFGRVSLFNITPVKKAHKSRTCWLVSSPMLIYQYTNKETNKYVLTYKMVSDNETYLLVNIIHQLLFVTALLLPTVVRELS